MKTALSALALILSATPILAEPQPFDMSPERPAEAASRVTLQPAEPELASPSPEEAPVPRYIVPAAELVLAGENTARSWSVYLTPEQATAEATLRLGYQSSIVVAPESSRLRFSINGMLLVDEPVQSPDGVAELTAKVPAGVLKPGPNRVTIEATQRHRTDCSIPSTYELWVDIDQSKTFLSFADAEATRFRRIDDVRAVGVDLKGNTSFNLVAPSAGQGHAAGPLIRLAEGLALLSNMPSQAVNVSREAPGQASSAGSLTVVVGTASELRDVLTAVPREGEVAPLAVFVDDEKLGGTALVITAPSWDALTTAIESIVSTTDRPASAERAVLSTQTWRAPDVPRLTSASRLSFSALGLQTQEFSGRRFRTDFAIGVPSDFYADSYGEATILLDAAYSQDVLPGSHIDVYVNDSIASTLPITAKGGEILRHLPIKVTMRHFRPGVNKVAIEAVLLTRADASCAPGTTGDTTGRFALFDTSEFVMPEFARIGRRPNLDAMRGTGFPYGRMTEPLPLVMDRSQPETLSAAATLLARMSVAAGRPIPVDPAVSAEGVGNRSALFVAPAAQLSARVLPEVGLSDQSGSNWAEDRQGGGSGETETQTTFNEWRDRLSGRGWRGQISKLEDWFRRKFDMSTDAIRLVPGADPVFTPHSDATVIVAQNAGPDPESTWTVVTAPTAKMLEEGVRELAAGHRWEQLGGRITVYSSKADKVEQVPVNSFSFVQTQPASLSNLRLVLSNWLSANVLSYSAFLAMACVGLGLATAALLGMLGRRK